MRRETERPLETSRLNRRTKDAGCPNARERIYIGEPDNIQGALFHHLQDLGDSLMKRKPTGFVFEICDGGRRPARQDRLVLEYEPVYNRQSPVNA